MNRFFLILLISFNCFAGAKKPVDVKPTIELKEVPSDLLNLNRDNKNSFSNVTKFSGFTENEMDRFWLYSKKMNEVISTKCFKSFIYNKKLTETNSKTNHEVLKEILTKSVDVQFTMYYSRKRTIGYTYPNQNRIWFNRRYHASFSICESASNMAHETTHKIGYDHLGVFDSSVPYSVGEGIELCCQ